MHRIPFVFICQVDVHDGKVYVSIDKKVSERDTLIFHTPPPTPTHTHSECWPFLQGNSLFVCLFQLLKTNKRVKDMCTVAADIKHTILLVGGGKEKSVW